MKKPSSSIKKVRTIHGVTEYVLPNGLRVLFRQDKSAPVVAVCVTFHVGSRNEVPGRTGYTHILEHMLFKDTERFNKKNGKAITDYLEWMGARINATTWLDRTNYFELLPRERVAEALAMEADRMRSTRFNDSDLASEMTVVRNEYERSRNNPYELLQEEVLTTAFTTHPYRIPTIGTKEDIEASTVASLREFYDVYYWPDNATLAIIGDVSKADVEKLVVKHFGKIPHAPHAIPPMEIVEPEQKQARTCEVKKQAGVSIAEITYKTPHGTHADFPALTVLATILAGGFSSRMQVQIVDKGIAADLQPRLYASHDPGTCSFVATATPGTPPKKVLMAMRAQITKLVAGGITQQELKRARERILSQLAGERDGVFNEIMGVSEALAIGDWTQFYSFDDAIRKLKRADIDRVAKRYLVPAHETSGVLIDSSGQHV